MSDKLKAWIKLIGAVLAIPFLMMVAVAITPYYVIDNLLWAKRKNKKYKPKGGWDD